MAGLTALFASTLALALYVRAATASLYDTYQPGIESFKARTDPTWLLLALAALLAVAAVWPARRQTLAQLLQHLLAWTFAVCVAVELLILGSRLTGLECSEGWAPHRGLAETLRTSTLCPSFSNRSFWHPYEGALLSVGLLALARYLARNATEWSPTWPQQLAAAFASAFVLAATPGMWAAVIVLVPESLPVPPVLLIPFGSVAIGLALQVLFYPVALLTTRRRPPLWAAPSALGALVLAAALVHPIALTIAPYVAFALLAQLAVLRTPVPRRI